MLDKSLLASGGYDHFIKMWDARGGNVVHTYEHPRSHVNVLSYDYNKKWLAAAGQRTVTLYDLHSPSTSGERVINASNVEVLEVGFLKDGNRFFTGSEDKHLAFWDLRTNSRCPIFLGGQFQSKVNCACVHPNERDIVVGLDDGYIHVMEMSSSFTVQLRPEELAACQDIDIDPQGMLLAAIYNSGKFFVWNVYNRGRRDIPVPVCIVDAHAKLGISIKFNSNGHRVISTSADSSARLWSTITFQLIAIFSAEQHWVWTVHFSNDEQHILTGSSDSVPKVWRVNTQEIIREFRGHIRGLTTTAFFDLPTGSMEG